MVLGQGPGATVEVVVIGCGEPKKAMGWFHLTQLLDDPRCNVTAVVEPFYLSAGKGAPGAARLAEWRSSYPDLKFCCSVQELPEPAQSEGGGRAPRLALIAARTCDAPRLFEEVVAKGATHVYLEKPGAENAADLSAMRAIAEEQGVQVMLGYNKNVCSFVLKAMERLRTCDAAALPEVVIEHDNAFSRGQEVLSFLRGAAAEGMIHNMCCHELALAVTLFGVSSARLRRVVLDPEFSEVVDIGNEKRDWLQLGFSLEMQGPVSDVCSPGGVSLDTLRILARRCAEKNVTRVRLQHTRAKKRRVNSGEEVEEDKEETFSPDPVHEAWVQKAQAQDPEMRPYLLAQSPDYQRLKSELIDHILAGRPGVPDGTVGMDAAVEVMRLADLLATSLPQCLEQGAPWSWSPPAAHASPAS